MSDFKSFADRVHTKYNDMAKTSELFVVRLDVDVFDHYLAAFPDGTNPLFRERTEHDCNCCKQYLRRLGSLVAVDSAGNRTTCWDLGDAMVSYYAYEVVAKKLHDLLMAAPIVGVFRSKERSFGTESNFDDKSDRKFHHFHGRVEDRHFSLTPDKKAGELNSTYQVLQRGLKELLTGSLETVLELIDGKQLYRGEEHRKAVADFLKLKNLWSESGRSEDFIWGNLHQPATRFRNTAIGTLVVDLSNDVLLERAVASFESKVAPDNYRRTSAPISAQMVENASKKLEELGLGGAIRRRMARPDDLNVNDVLFVDNDVRDRMKGAESLSDILGTSVGKGDKLPQAFTDIPVQTFLSEVLPGTRKLEAVVRPENSTNFVALTAAQDEASGGLFSWGNDFAWSYDGDVADASIRNRVEAKGGNVTNAALRISLAWFNLDDLDIWVTEPTGHVVYHGNKAGKLDVDMNVSQPVRDAVENVSYTRFNLRDGTYQVQVNQYKQREGKDFGFTLELENKGVVRQFHFDQEVRGKNTYLLVTVRDGEVVNVEKSKLVREGSMRGGEKWGVKLGERVPVETVLLSPNYWEQSRQQGNKHLFLMLKDCRSPDPVRGFFNEALRPELQEHRKVLEVLGSKTKCEPTEDQLAGVGFSSTNSATFEVVADGRPYRVKM